MRAECGASRDAASMSEPLILKKRRNAAPARTARRMVANAFTPPVGGVTVAYAYPGMDTIEEEDSRRTLVTGALAALLHLGVLGILIYLHSLNAAWPTSPRRSNP